MTESGQESSLIRSLMRSGGIVFLGLVVEMGLSFAAKILMARVLGPDGFGAVALGLTTFTILSYLVLIGMDTGISRFMPREDGRAFKRGVLVSGLQISVPLSLVCGGVLVALAPRIASDLFHDPTTTPILRVFAVVVPLSVFVKLSLGGIRGAKKSLPKVYLKNFLMPGARFGAIAVVLLAGWSAVGIAWAYVVSYALAAVLGLFYLHRYTPLFSRVSYASKHREMLAFSAPLVISAAMALVFDKIDTLMLGAFWPTSEVGVYNVVYPVAWALLVMLNAFGYLFMPTLSELDSADDGEAMKRMYQVTTKWVFLTTLPPFLGLVLYPRKALTMTFGPAYADGALSLVVLSFAFFTHAIVGPNKESLTSIGRTRTIMWDNAIVAGVNVVLNLLLIPRYSYAGAAVATACSYVLLNVLYSAQLYRETGIQPFTVSQLRPGAIAVGIVLLLYWLITDRFGTSLTSIAILVGTMAVVYPLVIARFSRFEPEEIQALRSVRNRVGGVSRAVTLFRR